jgi:hypothetical protein
MQPQKTNKGEINHIYHHDLYHQENIKNIRKGISKMTAAKTGEE